MAPAANPPVEASIDQAKQITWVHSIIKNIQPPSRIKFRSKENAKRFIVAFLARSGSQ